MVSLILTNSLNNVCTLFYSSTEKKKKPVSHYFILFNHIFFNLILVAFHCNLLKMSVYGSK